MKKVEMNNIDKKKLISRIDEVRYVLNEICSKIDENGLKEDILKVSESLDELIIDYMKLIKKESEDTQLL